jgi:hypothetical protein
MVTDIARVTILYQKPEGHDGSSPGGLAAAIIAQNQDGSLNQFDWLGYILVATSIVSGIAMYFVQKSAARRTSTNFV